MKKNWFRQGVYSIRWWRAHRKRWCEYCGYLISWTTCTCGL